MIATIVGRVAVDAGSADGERHESVRQRRVVLTPQAGVKFARSKLLTNDGDNEPGPPGRSRYKP
jgi:hypothetical protein